MGSRRLATSAVARRDVSPNPSSTERPKSHFTSNGSPGRMGKLSRKRWVRPLSSLTTSRFPRAMAAMGSAKRVKFPCASR